MDLERGELASSGILHCRWSQKIDWGNSKLSILSQEFLSKCTQLFRLWACIGFTYHCLMENFAKKLDRLQTAKPLKTVYFCIVPKQKWLRWYFYQVRAVFRRWPPDSLDEWFPGKLKGNWRFRHWRCWNNTCTPNCLVICETGVFQVDVGVGVGVSHDRGHIEVMH